MPRRRLFCFSSVGSRCLNPSGIVLDGELLDYVVALRGDGGGARPNRVCFISPRAFSAKFVDLFVILSFLDVRYVIVPPPLNESF
jgi:hypothetical protein